MGKLLEFPTNRESGLDMVPADSSPSVTLTVGQLRAVIRQEVRAVTGENGATRSGHKPPPQGTFLGKPYLTVPEAAELARVAPSTIRLYIRKGQLKRQKVGRRVIISRAELEKFLGSQPSNVELYPG